MKKLSALFTLVFGLSLLLSACGTPIRTPRQQLEAAQILGQHPVESLTAESITTGQIYGTFFFGIGGSLDTINQIRFKWTYASGEHRYGIVTYANITLIRTEIIADWGQPTVEFVFADSYLDTTPVYRDSELSDELLAQPNNIVQSSRVIYIDIRISPEDYAANPALH